MQQQNRLKNKCASFPSPHENITILPRLVNTQAPVICVSVVNLLSTVTEFVCRDESQDEETKQGEEEKRFDKIVSNMSKGGNTGSLSDFLSWLLLFHWC